VTCIDEKSLKLRDQITYERSIEMADHETQAGGSKRECAEAEILLPRIRTSSLMRAAQPSTLGTTEVPFSDVIVRASVTPITLHSLRDTHASVCARMVPAKTG
jgi:hypothetical protein